MKSAFIFALALFSSLSFAQDRCEMRVQKLQEKIAELSEENLRLQRRINELEERNRAQFLCSASCVNQNGVLDIRYLMTAIARTQADADLIAKREVQRKYSCNFGIHKYKCEVVRTEIERNFCRAACTDQNGVPEERYIAGGRGRNQTEAEVHAIQEVQKTYSCNFGIKIISCN